MDKDEKKITGSQESIQARLAALNALMHKKTAPAPSEEVPEEPAETGSSAANEAEAAEEVTVEVNGETPAQTGENEVPDEADAETASEPEVTAAETTEESSLTAPGEAVPEDAANEVFETETTAEDLTSAPAAEEAATVAEAVSDENKTEETSEEPLPEAVIPEETPAEETSSPSEEAPSAEETSTEEAPSEEAVANDVSEQEATAEEAVEATADSASEAESTPEETAPQEAEAEPAPEPQENSAEASAENTKDAPLRSAFMNTAALKERMAALMAGIQVNNGNSSSAAEAEPEPAPDPRKALKNLSVPNLIKTGFETLEQSDFEKAKEIFEMASEKDEKCASAYFGQLLASFNVMNTSEFFDLVLIRTRKNLPKKKVTPAINQDFDAFVRKECLCSSELDPKEVKILFGHLKTPYRSVVNGIDTTLNEGRDLVEVYCDYMGAPASELYHSFRNNATEEELSTYDINPSLRERLAQIKEEEIEHDRRRNTGEELQDLFRQVDEIYNATAGSELSPALRTARALQKAGRIGSIPFGHKIGSADPLGWVLVYSDGDKILLMTKDCISFSAFGQNNKWKDSEIRSWLNGAFYNESFTDAEKSLIRKETQENPANTKFNAEGGTPTEDQVFLFSIPEAIQYFSEEVDRASDEWYWLRSPGGGGNYIACVEPSGRIDEYGSLVTLDSGGVRPAIWISFSSKAE